MEKTTRENEKTTDTENQIVWASQKKWLTAFLDLQKSIEAQTTGMVKLKEFCPEHGFNYNNGNNFSKLVLVIGLVNVPQI